MSFRRPEAILDTGSPKQRVEIMRTTANPDVARRARTALFLALGLALLSGTASAGGDRKTPAPSGKDGAKGKLLFDGKSLTGWKATNFGGEGDVSVKDGAVVLGQGNDMTGITYAGKDFPKTDYEVTLEGKRVAGNDFFCTLTFPVGDSHCSFVVGGWGGTVVGLSSIDDRDASQNETGNFKDFKRGQWYRVRVRVTKHRIQAWIDDQRLVDLPTKDKKISIRPECELCRPFGIATWRTEGAVRNIRVRALTAAEKK
jgi:hypothetical protein